MQDNDHDNYAEALEKNRMSALAASFIVALFGLILLFFTGAVRYLSPMTWIVLASVEMLLCLFPLLLFIYDRDAAAGIIKAWLAVVGLAICGQIANYLFGQESHLILSRGWPPLLILFIPMFLVLARTFLVQAAARRVQWLFLLILLVISAVHLGLKWDHFETFYGVIMLWTSVMLLGPLIVILQDLHDRIHGLRLLDRAHESRQDASPS